MKDYPNMKVYTRSGDKKIEEPYEIPVVLPEMGDKDLMTNIWTEVRFFSNILHEHGLFFALLMPPELAKKERDQAVKFAQDFQEVFDMVESSKPEDLGDAKAFSSRIAEKIQPFIEYKKENQEAQTKGKLRSLVWPLFFDHTAREAERWLMRIQQLGKGEVDYDKDELVPFWTQIMDEHARFVAHLLDPDEYDLIEKAMSTSKVFQDLHDGGIKGTVSAATHEPKTVAESLIMHPEMSAVLSAVETILDFKTQAARGIEKGKIKSIIDPRLADHVRREALKFYDELQRVGVK